MNEKLNLSSGPHIRDRWTTPFIMGAVLLALLPTAVIGVVVNGLHALWIILASMASCFVTELVFDLGKLDYISSAGLRVLLSAHKRMADKGGMTVTADVAITDGNTVEHADLVLVGTRDGGTAKPVEIYGGQKRLRLTGVTQNQKQIRIESMPSVEAESKQPITTSVSTKPCICEQKARPSISPGLTSDFSNNARVVEQSADHHSSVSCSAPPSSEI